jgi:tetratricopeptide (TPR) repeat protein
MQSNVAQLSAFDKARTWYELHKKQTIWGASAIVIVGVIVWLVVAQRGKRETAASEALSAISTPQLGQAGARPDAANAYLKIASDYPKSSAAARALLLAAGSLFVDGKYAEAKTQFEKFTREHRDSPFMGQALLGIAASLDAQGKKEEASTAYKVIVDRHGNENVAPQARFALARLYEAQNKPEQARALFEELARSDPYGSLGSEAGMRLEELRVKHPELFTPIAPPTPALPDPVLLSNTPVAITPSNPPAAIPAAPSNSAPVLLSPPPTNPVSPQKP